MGADVILVIVVGTALAFDFTNGFHDTANVAWYYGLPSSSSHDLIGGLVVR